MRIDTLLHGFPGVSDHGALGLSNAVLVREGERVLLFDTGAHGARPVLLKALEEIGVAPFQVTDVFLSHLHYDHIQNVSLFENARIWVGEAEWRRQDLKQDVWVPMEIVQAIGSCGRLCLMQDGQEVLSGMTALHTPGHTLGHMSLGLKMQEGTLLLAGDAIKNRRELELLKAPWMEKVQSFDSILPGHDALLCRTPDGYLPQETARLCLEIPFVQSTQIKEHVELTIQK